MVCIMEARGSSFYRGARWPRWSGAGDGDDGARGRERSAGLLRTMGDVEAVLTRVVAQPMEDGSSRDTSCTGTGTGGRR
jgi:hypothetical protein